MSQDARSDFDRLNELLVDRATVGLDPDERAELAGLFQQLGIEDDLSLDLTCAAVDLAVGQEDLVTLPDHLRLRAMAGAANVLESFQAAGGMGQKTSRSGGTGPRARDLLALAALAASLLLATYAWITRPTPLEPPVAVDIQRQQLIDSAPGDLVQVSWTPIGDPGEGVTGDVVWSDQRQAGYMRFQGLPPNDPRAEQYQLWIFDEERDERYPVDGGVFDIVDDSGETVIAIDPKIQVNQATQFAITVEVPGGVVVSDRSRLPLLAIVGDGG